MRKSVSSIIKDARMEWNRNFTNGMEDKSSILQYQFHTRFRSWYLQKKI